MKLKEIPRSATFAWSPRADAPGMFTGTAAGTIDADFSAATALEKWDVDLLESGSPAAPSASVTTDGRFHAVSVSADGAHVVGALETGVVEVWQAADLKSVHRRSDAHSGPARAAAFSPRDARKFATGGPRGEVLVWSLDALDAPVAQGAGQAQLHDEVNSVAWNNSVDYILASAGSKGFCSIWDTRSRREVMHLHHLSAAGHRVPFSTVQWHPLSNTKLATASVDDNEPVICIWDLKNANSPERVLRGHSKGVLTLDWCRHDADLLLSGGRDDSTRLWNPTLGAELGAYPLSVEWAFKTSFHPNLPDIFASASFDGKISVQTLQDTRGGGTSTAKTDGADFWENDNVLDAVHPAFVLKQAPKWLSRPITASFGFGGKLVVARDGKVEVHTVEDAAFDLADAHTFGEALRERDFKAYYDTDEDWKLLGRTANGEQLLDLPSPAEEDDEFMVIPQFVPDSSYELLSGSAAQYTPLLLANDFEKVVAKLVDAGDVGDALLVASYGGPELVARVQNAFLAKRAAERPYLRLAWAIATKNALDLVEHTELEAWPHVLKFALAQPEPARATATTTLAGRLARADRRDDAVKVGIAAGNAAALAGLWLDEMPTLEKTLLEKGDATRYTAHAAALQQVVQKIAAAADAFGLPPVDSAGAERLYSAFRDFADLAAQHGDLELAKLFLNMLPETYAAEKQRVDVATAPTEAERTQQTQKAQRLAQSQQSQQTASTRRPQAAGAKPARAAASATYTPQSLDALEPSLPAPGPSPARPASLVPQGISPARASLSQPFIERTSSPQPPSSSRPPSAAAVQGWNDLVELPLPGKSSAVRTT